MTDSTQRNQNVALQGAITRAMRLPDAPAVGVDGNEQGMWSNNGDWLGDWGKWTDYDKADPTPSPGAKTG